MDDDGFGIELLHAVMAADLTPLQRETFIDCAVIGRTLREVALERGVHKSAVGQLLALSRAKLVAAIGEELAA